MEYIPAKTIVTANKHTAWFGADYNMNIYRGCSHGCIYCDSRSECYRVDDFDVVKAKINSTVIIAQNLASKRKKGVVATGAMSDPYNPMEAEYKLTRAALEQILRFGFGVGIATKSGLIARDADILREISSRMPVIAKITITTTDERIAGAVEPNAPPAAERLAAISKLSDQGIFTGVLLMPVLPFIEDSADNISAIIKSAAECGARFIYPGLGVTLRDRQRDWFFARLDELYPGLSKRYDKVFGSRYNCSVRDARKLYAQFSAECKQYGLLYKMQDIISAYKGGHGEKQLTFF